MELYQRWGDIDPLQSVRDQTNHHHTHRHTGQQGSAWEAGLGMAWFFSCWMRQTQPCGWGQKSIINHGSSRGRSKRPGANFDVDVVMKGLVGREYQEHRFRGKPNSLVAKFASIANSGLMISNTLVPLYSPYLIQRERKSKCQSNWGEVQHSSSPDDRRNRCHSPSMNNAHFILGTTVIYRSVSYFFGLFRPSEKAHVFFRW